MKKQQKILFDCVVSQVCIQHGINNELQQADDGGSEPVFFTATL